MIRINRLLIEKKAVTRVVHICDCNTRMLPNSIPNIPVLLTLWKGKQRDIETPWLKRDVIQNIVVIV